jgi:prepilin-type N-terminal cleavage/methylation domain-containing protein
LKLRWTIERQSGFTLIELVVTGALMTIVLAGGFLCLNAGFATQRLVDSRSEALQSARVALQLIAADLRNAVPLAKDAEFLGMHRTIESLDADNLDFASRNYIPRKSRESDWCEVSYFVEEDKPTKTMTLFRRRDASRDPEPLAGGSREEIARGLRGFLLEYYDGYEWYSEWGDPTGKEKMKLLPEPNTSGLPEAVRITLTIDPASERKKNESGESPEPPLVLQTTARVNLSLFFYRTFTGSGTNSASGVSAEVPGAVPGGSQ